MDTLQRRQARRSQRQSIETEASRADPGAPVPGADTPPPDFRPSPCVRRPAAQGTAAPAAEIELKLALFPGDIERLLRLPVVKESSRGRPRPHALHSVYYDTSEQHLRRDGVALRLRRDGSRWIQTLKTAGTSQGGLHVRQELETTVPAQLLDFQVLAESGASPVFKDPELRAELHPIFVTDFRRITRHLETAPGTRIELCADTGSIAAGPYSAPINEVELELKQGAADALVDFALRVCDQLPFRLEPASKAERGYALATGVPSTPVKATAPALATDMTVSQAFSAVVFGCVGHLQANERGLLETDDAEYLHQARVAVRRLRSAFSVFSRAIPRAAVDDVIKELRWLGGLLGQARDWDVFALETLPAILGAFPGDLGLHELLERTAELRAAADAGARDAVASRRYTTLLLQLIGTMHRAPWLAWPDEAASAQRVRPLLEFAMDVLARRHRRVVRRGRGLAELDPPALHELRIEIKKLRYAAEFLSALYDRKMVRDYTSALAQLQSRLGSINDAMAVERLCEQLRDRPQEADRPTSEAIGLARGWAAATQRAHFAELPAAWEAFRAAPKFWKV
jgi:inorganic triphosphatase YgiF